MPKKTSDFPANINFNCPTELRQQLIALSYLRGGKGSFAAPARDLLTDKMLDTIRTMDERRRRDFDEILETIKAREAIAGNKKPQP